MLIRHGKVGTSTGRAIFRYGDCGRVCDICRLQPRLEPVPLIADSAPSIMSEPVDMVLGSIIVGFLSAVMIIGSVAAIVV
jgi:hypothetical protein